MVNRFMQTEVCYKIADRHHGKTGSRDIRRNDVVAETN
jgi:hypothetical protein